LAYILCPICKFKTLDEYVMCKHCGNPLPGASRIPPLLALTVISGLAPSGGFDPYSPHVMRQGVTSIGRMDDNIIVLLDERVSRHHATIHRDQDGSYLVEDLDSSNGTFLNGDRLKKARRVKAGDLLKIGDTVMRLDVGSNPDPSQPGMPPRPEATLIRLPKLPLTSQSSGEPKGETLWTGEMITEDYSPQACEGWALKQLPDEDESVFYILKGLDNQGYLRLTERDVFIWKMMDGKHTLRDILVAYFQSYRAIGTDRLVDLLHELNEKGFLKSIAPRGQSKPRGVIASGLYYLRRVFGAFYQKQFSIHGADEWITRIYTHFGWFFYTRIGQLILAAIALSGLAAFAFLRLSGDQSMFVVNDSAVMGIIVLAIASVISIFFHQVAHALTVKAYNRQVPRVGFKIYFGMPAFFVDTSDIWMEAKSPRIHASLAGPYGNLVIGSIASLIMLSSLPPLFHDVLFQLAALSYLSVFVNLNPLLEMDGYYILVDWLGMPLLRKRSLEFVQHQFLGKLRRREVFSRDEKLFCVFGILSAMWTAIAVGIFFLYKGPRLFELFL